MELLAASHQHLGYLLLVLVWAVVGLCGWQAFRGDGEDRLTTMAGRAFVGLMDLQVVLGGVMVWSIGPQLGSLLAPWVNHVVLMILAAAVGHVGNRLSGYWRVGLFLAAGVLMMAGWHFGAMAPLL